MRRPTSDVLYNIDLAGPDDDVELRRLLRDNPVGGNVSLGFEREPSFFAAAAVEGDDNATIVARTEGSSDLFALGSRSVRHAYVNGQVCRLGYLSQLRVDRHLRGRTRLVQAGYRKMKELHQENGPTLYVTTVAKDNEVARRFLEGGLNGEPVYRAVDTQAVVVLPVGERRRASGMLVQRAEPAQVEQLAAFLQQQYVQYQFAPQWTPELLTDPQRCRDLHVDDFYVLRRRQDILGCAALWDQRAFKQCVLRGMHSVPVEWLDMFRAAHGPLGSFKFPSTGTELKAAFISHLAVTDNDPTTLHALVSALLHEASNLGYLVLATGLSTRHPLYEALKNSYQMLTYESILYVVHWEDGRAAADALDDRIPHIELAVL